MKAIIGIGIFILVIVGVWQIWAYWEKVNKEKMTTEQEMQEIPPSSYFEGLPPTLQRPLQQVENKPDELRQFLDKYRTMIKDPRLAAIELDYMLMISREKPEEARKVFASVKKRIPESSPLYKRIKALEKTYE